MSSVIKVAIYFGSFSPFHHNHMNLCMDLRQRGFDYIYVIPNQHNQMKPYMVSYEHRLAMIESTVKHYGLSDSVIAYDSKIEHHNWQGRNAIVKEIQNNYVKLNIAVEMYQIIGQDSYEKTIHRCQKDTGIYSFSGRHLLVYPRLDCHSSIVVPESLKEVVKIMEYKDPIVCSSTQIRHLLQKGTNLSSDESKQLLTMINQDTYDYIIKHHIYEKIPLTGRIVGVFGGPGSGKGSLCEALIKSYPSYIHISTGDLYREDEKKNTPAYQLLVQAKLRSFQDYNTALHTYIIDKLHKLIDPTKYYLLDGLKPNDLWAFEQKIATIDQIIVLNCRYNICYARLKKRYEIHHRIDDQEMKIKHRLGNYFKYLYIQQEILNSYQSTGRQVIDIMAEKALHYTIKLPIWKQILIK